MEAHFAFSGEVVERQELLNGTESVTVVARSVDGQWRLTMTVAWNLGVLSYTGEGDITIEGDGVEAYGSLAEATAARGDGCDWLVEATFDIDGVGGSLAEGVGMVRAQLELTANVANGHATMNLG